MHCAAMRETPRRTGREVLDQTRRWGLPMRFTRSSFLRYRAATIGIDWLRLLGHQLHRKGQLTKALQELAMRERYATRVGLLRCFRGIETVTAMTILAELFSFERFDTAKKLMGHLRLSTVYQREISDLAAAA